MRNSDMFKVPFFVRGDFDGFIGLFIDNLVNLLIITGLCLSIGMDERLIFGRILPATALSVLAGNIFYAWQSRRLARREQRLDVTALPYGINTVSLLAFFSLIIMPVYVQTKDAELAWQVGVMSCLISGIFEGLGAFFGDFLRRISPRAALLATLAGIAIAFIALDHTIKIWDKPVIAFIPLALILVEYFSHVRLPFRIPAGFYALFLGSLIAWTTGAMDGAALTKSIDQISLHVPDFALFSIFTADNMARMVPYLSISVPMGLMSFFGTLQNIESASAAGDTYRAMPALAMNGAGTVVGALFGSPFPTTVYIGHPGWKGLGARSGYSVLNGAVITLICFTGLMSVVVSLIPLEAGYPILLWIGVVITAQAFQTTPGEHAPAVALGLMPAIAAWGLSLLRQFVNAGGGKPVEETNRIIAATLPHLKGILVFAEGPLFSAMFLTGVAVYIIEKNFLRAFYWTLPLIAFSWLGLIHSPAVGWGMAGMVPLGYGLFAGVLLLVWVYERKGRGADEK